MYYFICLVKVLFKNIASNEVDGTSLLVSAVLLHHLTAKGLMNYYKRKKPED